jgi:hypothetical protein
MRNLFFAILAAMTMTSCSTAYMAKYNVVLAQVEKPSDAGQQYGETAITTVTEGEISRYYFEDEFIQIYWRVTPEQFQFELKNKGAHTIKIDWDAITFVDINGRAGRVIHEGVRYTDKNNSQASTNIPRNARITELLLPVDNIQWKGYNWVTLSLIPSYYSTSQAMNEGKGTYVGKKMSILFPIDIAGVTNDYIFEFLVKDVY